MKRFGMLLFLVGFIGTAFVIVRQAGAVDWSHYAATMFVAALGVVALRLHAAAQTVDEAKTASDMSIVHESLRVVLDRIERLNAEREDVGVYGVHGRIDAELMDPINQFVEVRETIITVHGLDSYARTMDAFAGGERALNRAWSASADGYIDEVWACLERAERQMKKALGVVEGLSR